MALVTGGSRGIGRATAQFFAQIGAKVVIGDVDPSGSETVEEIKRGGGEAIFVETDVSSEGAVEYANQGIRINALAPGLVNTAMTKDWFDESNMSAHFIANTPISRVSQPAEIAGMVLFLCSELASFAVDQTFVIDGG